MTTSVVVSPAGHPVRIESSEGGGVVEVVRLEPGSPPREVWVHAGRSVTVSEASAETEHPGMAAAMSPSPQAPEVGVGGSAQQLPVAS